MDAIARYDGLAEWYEAEFADGDSGRTARAIALRLLGPGPGRLLDVGCGTGAHAVVHADASALPFGEASFDAAVSVFTHTDIDDFAGAMKETARVLRPGGRFVYLGVHPCFVGPHAFIHDRDVPELHPGYRDTSFQREAPGIWSDGVRARAGAGHLPLGLFLHSFLDAGLRLELFEEPRGRDYPYIVALQAER